MAMVGLGPLVPLYFHFISLLSWFAFVAPFIARVSIGVFMSLLCFPIYIYCFFLEGFLILVILLKTCIYIVDCAFFYPNHRPNKWFGRVGFSESFLSCSRVIGFSASRL